MYCSLVNLVSGHNFIHLNFLGLFIVIAVAAIFSKVSFYSLFRKDKKESVNDSVLEKTIPMLKDGNISLDVIALEKTMVYVNLKFTNHLTSIKNYLIQYKMIILIKKPLMV